MGTGELSELALSAASHTLDRVPELHQRGELELAVALFEYV